MLLCGVICPGVQGHGRLMEPPSRGSMWRAGFNTPKDYLDDRVNCGGLTASVCAPETVSVLFTLLEQRLKSGNGFDVTRERKG